MNERILAALLLGALLLVVLGCATWSTGVALIVAGAGLAAWSWLIFGDVDAPPEGEPPDAAE